jgi:hypothetical protein
MTHFERKIRAQKKAIRKLEHRIKREQHIEAKEKKFKEKHFRAGLERSLSERRIKA